MPGGGEIGGGSCSLKFKVFSTDPKNPDDQWECHDKLAKEGLVNFAFPDGSTKTVDLKKPGTIIIDWS